MSIESCMRTWNWSIVLHKFIVSVVLNVFLNLSVVKLKILYKSPFIIYFMSAMVRISNELYVVFEKGLMIELYLLVLNQHQVFIFIKSCTFYLSSVWKNLFGLAWCNFIQKWPWSLWSYCEIVFPPDGSHSCIYVNLVVILFMINSYCKFVLFDCKYFILLVKWKQNWNIHLWVIMCRWSR